MKARHKMCRKAKGGEIESAKTGDKDFEMDLKDKPMRYTAKSNVQDESEERKRGGKVKKHVGKVGGEKAMKHAGRKARKSGGRTGSNFSPLSSAHAGTAPKAHKPVEID